MVLDHLIDSDDTDGINEPIKIDGNPDVDASRGATDVFAQASVLDVYDPDRSREPILREGGEARARGWNDFQAELQPRLDALRAAGGAKLAVLSEASASPTFAAARRRLLDAMPEARWCEYEAVSRDELREGTRLAFGRPCETILDLTAADVNKDGAVDGADVLLLLKHLQGAADIEP